MLSSSYRGAVFAAILACVPGVASAGFDDKNPITFVTDGATAQGYIKVVTEAINGIVRDAYPGTSATYQPGSPAGGILKISTGQADFVYNGGGPEIGYALEGRTPFQESLKGKFKYVLMLHNQLVVHSLMTREWSEKHGIKSFADIAAKKPPMRLAVNTTGNLQSTVGMYGAIFDVYGIDEKAVTTNGGSMFRGNSNSSLEAMRDGKIDVSINGSFPGAADVAEVGRARDLLWISSTPEKAKAAGAKWGYDAYKVKAGLYPFVTKDEDTHTLWSAVLVGSHVPDETVYKFVKALHENEAKVRSIHPSLAAFDLKVASVNPTSLALHPGAERYYRQIGILK